jgi:hypothetical protein
MAKIEFQVCPAEAFPVPSDISVLHTGTLKKMLDIARVSPDKYYKFIRNNRVVITRFDSIKKILDTRENILNKQERKLKRQSKAKNAKH